ncbi:hypothetical protein ACWCP6_01225 [Streptomyces sp. NPDC002004]
MPPTVAAAEPSADRTRRGERRSLRRTLRSHHRVPLLATALAAPAYALWAVFLATGGGDLAAQVAWTGFVAHHPGTPYNLSWYGGVHVADYSVLAPALMAVCGVRTVTVAAGLAATWLAAGLFVRSGVRRPLWPALLAAFGLWCDVASGRSTFALGVALGLAACSVLTGTARRPVPAGAALSALAALASPVAGLFLLVAGAGWLLAGDRGKAAAAGLPPVLVVGAATLLFPFGGVQPMATGDIWKPLLFGVLTALFAPRSWRALRGGAAVYAAGVVLTALVESPVGSNVVRLAELFAPAVLLAVCLVSGLHPVRRAAFATALVLSLNWVSQHAVDVLRMSTPVPAWAVDTRGVVAALDRLGAGRTRVEAVPARNHRETTALAPHVDLARGWNRQLDVERGPLFYDGSFSAEAYRDWLDHWGVGLVVLPHAAPDWAAEEEAALVRRGPAWLKPAWHDAHWSVFRVENAVPLVTAPARVVRSGAADVVVHVPRRGRVTVRIAYSPWLRAGGACVERAGAWTRLAAPRAGDYRISSSYRPRWPGPC